MAKTIFTVWAALVAWSLIAILYFKFEVDKSPTPPRPPDAPPHVSVVEFQHVADIISASHNNTPIIAFACALVAIVWIIAHALVRISDNRRYIPPPYQDRLPPPQEQHRGNLPVVRR